MTRPWRLDWRKRREAAADRAYPLLRRVGRRAGFHVVRSNFYSPIPDVGALSPATWETPAPMPGVDWDLDRQLAWVHAELGAHLAAFRPPPGFTLANPFFGAVDAQLLDAVVRWARPRRVVELGSGFSTLLIADALGEDGEHVVVDPYASGLTARARRPPRIERVSTADAPGAWFAALEAGDVLFADTTHTVKLGGDVPRLVLDVLPRLAPGVLVHVHDVFWPYPYPRALYETYGVYWQEQELVQALLADSPRWEVLAASHSLWRDRRTEVERLLPGTHGDIAPSSLWLRRV